MRILVAAIGKLKRGAESDLSERYRERAAKSGRGIGLRSLDIVELNPFLDERGRTARVAVELIGSLFGQQIADRPTPSNAIAPGE